MTPEQDTDAPFARPSATIVVIRDCSPAPELLMVKRRAGDAFGDSYAFPGGVVDPDEARANAFGSGVAAEEANAILGLDADGLDYLVAGIRELFEETRILLAKDTSGSWKNCGAEIDALRRQVDKGSLSWADFLQQQRLTMAFDALHYFAHWETPLNAPKRWTTRFFVAQLPAGQDACHDGSETTDSRWMQVTTALHQREAGNIRLPHPTIKTLESLSEFRSIDEIFEWSARQRKAGILMQRLPGLPRAGLA